MALLDLRAVGEEAEVVRLVGAEVVVGVVEEARDRQSLFYYYETLSTSLSVTVAHCELSYQSSGSWACATYAPTG